MLDEPSRIGHMDPDTGRSGRCDFEAQGIVEILGVWIVDRDAVEMAQIAALGVTSTVLLGTGHERGGLGLELGAKPVGPRAVAQRRQGMGIPLAQINQQMTDLRRLKAAMALPQGGL